MGEPQSIVNFPDFLGLRAGRYVLAWEQRLFDQAVVDIFGYNALQLGLPQVDALQENRMPLRCIALDGSDRLFGSGQAGAPLAAELAALRSEAGAPGGQRVAALVSRFDELPFASQSIDLLVLPHVLEFAQEPHRVLREADRVLVPEGQIVITGFNPASLWGTRHWMGRLGLRPFLPPSSQMITLPRLKDWLKLLSFEVHRGRFGCYVPPCAMNPGWRAGVFWKRPATAGGPCWAASTRSRPSSACTACAWWGWRASAARNAARPWCWRRWRRARSVPMKSSRCGWVCATRLSLRPARGRPAYETCPFR